MLTDKQVKSLSGLNRMIADGGGLYVRISAEGRKTFLYRTRTGGKARYVTLGEYPTLSLSKAREKVGELQGKNVGDYTVAHAVTEYLKSLDYKHPGEVKRRLEKDVVPELGKKRLSLVTAGDISKVLQGIVDRGSPVSANRTLADVRHVFDFAYQKGWVESDPSLRITRKVVGGREKSREVVLSHEEIASFVEVMLTERFGLSTRTALLVMLLTGQRASEVLGISKDEVDGVWWTIPAERMKAGRMQRVFLTYPVRLLLREVDYSFSGDHRVLARALSRLKVRYTPHDLRRTMATKLSENGVAPHVIEKMLSHQMEGVMAVYNRAEYLKERRTAWLQWWRLILRLVRTSSVPSPHTRSYKTSSA